MAIRYNPFALRTVRTLEPGGRIASFGVHATRAKVAELVDALDLGSSGATRESSSLSFRTSFRMIPQRVAVR